MGKKQVKLGLFTSVYSYFLYLLLKGYDENDIIIVHNSFPESISKNINPIVVPVEAVRSGGIKQSIKGLATYIFNYLKLRILLFIKTFNKDVVNYGHPFSGYAFMFYENENSNIIEDGLANYSRPICKTHKINPIIDALLHVAGIYFLKECEAHGSHKNIKNIYLTNENNHPLIKDKVRVIDIKQLWNDLNRKKQNEILEIFNIDLKDFNLKNEIALILTEPFTEEKLMSLDEELSIYRSMIEKFKDMDVIIKPHPRDLKNYAEIFPNAKVIDKQFPVELLTLININPTVVCSVISTALYHFEKSKIYVYDGTLNSEHLNNAREELLKIIKEKNLDLID